MADEDLSTPVETEPAPLPTVEPADVEKPTDEQPVDVSDDLAPESSDSDDDGDQPAIEYVTLERNGKQFQVPKELEGEFLMQGDYTKKTQTVAEKAKELEAREQRIAQQAEASEAELDARATLKSVKAEIERMKDYDWQAHQQHRRTDPMAADEAWQYKAYLQEQKAELEGTISKASTERTEKAQQDLAKRVQETLEAAPKIIPGLTPETRAATIEKLVAFAHSEGIPEQVMKANWSPTFLGLLHKAHIGAQAIAKQSAPKPAAPVAIAPLATVKAQASPATSRSVADLAKGDDMEAYAAARRAGKGR